MSMNLLPPHHTASMSTNTTIGGRPLSATGRNTNGIQKTAVMGVSADQLRGNENLNGNNGMIIQRMQLT